MKKYILSWALSAILLAGCTQESVTDETLDKGQDLIFETLSSKNSGTRTTVDAGGLVTWSASDEIRVNGISSSKTTLLDGGSAAQFMVSGVTGTNFYALYPSAMVTSYSNGKYELNLPATQKYKDNVTFSDNANPSVAYSSSSSSGDAYKLAFYNLCGIMKVNIKAASGPISGIKYVRLTTNEDIAGSFNADCQTNVLSAGAGTKYKTIDISFGEVKSTDDNITVYFVLPPYTYSAGWKISLLDDTKTALSETNPAAEQMRIVRSKRIYVTVDAGANKPSMIMWIKKTSFKPWNQQQSSPTKVEIDCMLANGLYWDTDGPTYRAGSYADPRTDGWWIKVNGLDSSLTTTVARCLPATQFIRDNPDFTFLPAAGRPGSGFPATWDGVGYGFYGVNQPLLEGPYELTLFLRPDFGQCYAYDAQRLTLPWNARGPILE